MISKILAKIFIIFIGAISAHTPLLAETDKVIVAGGCFWCVEADFEGLDGIKEAISGYTGGTLKTPPTKK
jgi:peptide-methionine (S)-S-oxide reductase